MVHSFIHWENLSDMIDIQSHPAYWFRAEITSRKLSKCISDNWQKKKKSELCFLRLVFIFDNWHKKNLKF